MSTRTFAQELATALGLQAGISDLILDENGACALKDESGLVVTIEHPEGSDQLYVCAPVGSVPTGDEDEIFRKCLTANFLGFETGGASLALDDSRNELVLWFTYPLAALTTENFPPMISRFLKTAQEWRQKLGVGEIEVAESLPEFGLRV